MQTKKQKSICHYQMVTHCHIFGSQVQKLMYLYLYFQQSMNHVKCFKSIHFISRSELVSMKKSETGIVVFRTESTKPQTTLFCRSLYFQSAERIKANSRCISYSIKRKPRKVLVLPFGKNLLFQRKTCYCYRKAYFSIFCFCSDQQALAAHIPPLSTSLAGEDT